MTTIPSPSTALRLNPKPFLSPKTINPNPNPSLLPLHHSLPPFRLSVTAAITAAATPSPSPLSLKSRLAAGDPLYGLFLLSFSPALAEIAALSGYDFVVVDLEHGPGSLSDALPCLLALAAARTPAILRLPDLSPVWAKKALDLGPQGLMFPSIDSPSSAAAAVAASRYPPRGLRGAAHPIVRASSYGLDDGYLARCEDDLLIMCQVESAKGLESIDEIAAVEGVDCIQMGPLDLSASMGLLWDPGNRKVRAAMREAERKVLDGKKAFLGGFAMQHDRPEDLKARGYHMVSGAADLAMFRKAAVEDVMRFQRADTEIGEEESGDEKEKEAGYWSE